MRLILTIILATTLGFTVSSGSHAESFRIAAASDLRFALDEIIALYRENHPDHHPEVVYGSSGRMTTQIANGAPYDIFFSADIQFPQRLQELGETANEPTVYALGRIVLWSSHHDASALTLQDLTDPGIRRIAIAQPAHAPYGMRAQEALEAAGVWEAVQSKLVFGENIAHAAQMAESGAADIGIIALSLALFPSMNEYRWRLIDDSLHKPLTQGYVVTRYGRSKESAHNFATFMQSPEARKIMRAYGFVMPED